MPGAGVVVTATAMMDAVACSTSSRDSAGSQAQDRPVLQSDDTLVARGGEAIPDRERRQVRRCDPGSVVLRPCPNHAARRTGERLAQLRVTECRRQGSPGRDEGVPRQDQGAPGQRDLFRPTLTPLAVAGDAKRSGSGLPLPFSGSLPAVEGETSGRSHIAVAPRQVAAYLVVGIPIDNADISLGTGVGRRAASAVAQVRVNGPIGPMLRDVVQEPGRGDQVRRLELLRLEWSQVGPEALMPDVEQVILARKDA